MKKVFFDKLYKSIKDHPEKWEYGDKYAIKHMIGKGIDMSIWVSNGWDCLRIEYPYEIGQLNLFQKIKLWQVIKPIVNNFKAIEEKKAEDFYNRL